MSNNGSLDIRSAETAEDIKQCYKVMRQLRPHLLDEVIFVEQVQRQIKEGYNLVYIEKNKEVQALAGFRFLEFWFIRINRTYHKFP